MGDFMYCALIREMILAKQCRVELWIELKGEKRAVTISIFLHPTGKNARTEVRKVK
jgi:hypothetical protein